MAAIRGRRLRMSDRIRHIPFLIALPGVLLALFLFFSSSKSRTHDVSSISTAKSGVKTGSPTTPSPTAAPADKHVYEMDNGHSLLHSKVHLLPINGAAVGTDAKNEDESEQAGVAAANEESAANNGEEVGEESNTDGRRITCQIVYIVGTEGSGHHGVSDKVIKRLAQRQGAKTLMRLKDFRKILVLSPLAPLRHNDKIVFPLPSNESNKLSPKQIGDEMNKLCGPKYDGKKKTIILEDISFPAGEAARRQFRGRPPVDVQALLEFQPFPIDLRKFSEVLSPFADIKFLVLHRPFVNTVFSHPQFDGGIAVHGDVIAGHLLYLGNIFGENKDANTVGSIPWKLICVDKFRNDANTETDSDGKTLRQRLISQIASFLDWEQTECDECFSGWKDSTKIPAEIDSAAASELEKKREELKSIWPPRGGEDCPL